MVRTWEGEAEEVICILGGEVKHSTLKPCGLHRWLTMQVIHQGDFGVIEEPNIFLLEWLIKRQHYNQAFKFGIK